MTTRGAAVALLAVVALLTSGCTGGSGGTPTPDPSAADASRRTACRAAVVELVDTTQRYVNGYADVSLRTDGSQPTSTPSPDPHAVTDDDLQAAVTRTVRTRDQQRCDPPSFSSQLDQGLSALTAQGPVAAAVMRQLRADFTGKVATDAATVPVAAGTDLATAVAEAASGSTLELAAGTFRLSETLVLLRGVTLRGAGVGTTTLVSTAADASVLVLTAGRVVVEDLTVRHGGRSDASVLVGGSTASLQVRRTRLTGARLGDGGGGAGLLMTAAEKAPPATGTTLEVTDVVVDGNEGAGITLTGTHRASIVGAEVRDNGQCGVCFLGATSGAVRQSTFTGNAAAVAATGRATPQVRDNRIEGGQVGVQATGHAAPVLTANTIVGAARAAVIYQGHAAGRADRTRCRDVTYGLVVGPDALPFLGRNDCTVVRSR